jgi:hypothetical protein
LTGNLNIIAEPGAAKVAAARTKRPGKQPNPRVAGTVHAHSKWTFAEVDTCRTEHLPYLHPRY